VLCGQGQCKSYEKRIRELEQRLAEQHMEVQKYRSGERRERSGRGSGVGGEVEQVEGGREEDGESSETSALTGDGGGRAQGSLGVPEPMDEGMISNIQGSSSASIETRGGSMSGRRGGTREGGDEVMSDVSGMGWFVRDCFIWCLVHLQLI
jgi:autophagy-related protein 11